MPIVPLPAPVDPSAATVVSYIQLAVAPVFLLSGVSAMLGVLVNRLSRIIDRARHLEGRYTGSGDAGERRCLRGDLSVLSLRARLVSRAITACTTCSLFVSLVVVMLFLQSLLNVYLHGVVPLLFILAMAAFVIGLVLFLREIRIATAALRIGPLDDEAS